MLKPVGSGISWVPDTLQLTAGTVSSIEQLPGTGKTNIMKIEPIYILTNSLDTTETNQLQDIPKFIVERTIKIKFNPLIPDQNTKYTLTMALLNQAHM